VKGQNSVGRKGGITRGEKSERHEAARVMSALVARRRGEHGKGQESIGHHGQRGDVDSPGRKKAGGERAISSYTSTDKGRGERNTG